MRGRSLPRELLVEQGFEGTTMQAVAKHSGVHASALYRRWPSRIELIQEAIFPGFDPPAVAPTGDLRADLLRFLEEYLAVFGSPAAGRPPRGSSPTTRRPSPTGRRSSTCGSRPDRSSGPSSPRLRPVRSTRRLDPDDVFDILLGAIFARTIVPTIAARQAPIERTVDLLVRMVRPLG